MVAAIVSVSSVFLLHPWSLEGPPCGLELGVYVRPVPTSQGARKWKGNLSTGHYLELPSPPGSRCPECAAQPCWARSPEVQSPVGKRKSLGRSVSEGSLSSLLKLSAGLLCIHSQQT